MVNVNKWVAEMQAREHPVEHLLHATIGRAPERLLEHRVKPLKRRLACRRLAQRVGLGEDEGERLLQRQERAHKRRDERRDASHRTTAVDAKRVAVDQHDKPKRRASLGDLLESDGRRNVDLHACRVFVTARTERPRVWAWR